MAPKAKKSGKAEKKAAPKASAKGSEKAAKGSKKMSASADEESPELLAPAVDQEELEEEQDAALAASSSQSGNAAALAAATGAGEMSASFKNFRHHPDMENFYRFIFDNDLRHEALAIIDEIMIEKQKRKLLKSAKSQAH